MLWHASAYTLMRIRAHVSNHGADALRHPCMLVMQDMKHKYAIRRCTTGIGLALTLSMPFAKAAGSAASLSKRVTCISAFGLAAIWLMSQRLCSPQ